MSHQSKKATTCLVAKLLQKVPRNLSAHMVAFIFLGTINLTDCKSLAITIITETVMS